MTQMGQVTYLRSHSQGTAELGFQLFSLLFPLCFLLWMSFLCFSRPTLLLPIPLSNLGDPPVWTTYGLSCPLVGFSHWHIPGGAQREVGHIFLWLLPCEVHLGWWCPSANGHCSSEGGELLLVSATVISSLCAQGVLEPLLLSPVMTIPSSPTPHSPQ